MASDARRSHQDGAPSYGDTDDVPSIASDRSGGIWQTLRDRVRSALAEGLFGGGRSSESPSEATPRTSGGRRGEHYVQGDARRDGLQVPATEEGPQAVVEGSVRTSGHAPESRGAQNQAAAAAVSVRVDDSRGWDPLEPGPADRPWHERADDLEEALEAWRRSFLVRRIVTLTRSYVVGDGITISSPLPEVHAFVQAFWHHRQNRMPRRLGPMCDELTRAGELFPVLHTNRVDGMSYVRFVPASQIREIETAENDYQVETHYGQLQRAGSCGSTAELKWWIGPGHRHAYQRSRGGRGGRLEPLMLHFCVNKPIGATRGESDLAPILPWALRYSEWLKDRVRLNRQRTRQALMDIEIADDAIVEQKRQQLRTANPIEQGIYVHGPGEKVILHDLAIEAQEAEADGRALRLAVATGANAALHYLGEGEAVNYATAKEMGEPTARFYAERQADFCAMLLDLAEAAYRRKTALGLATWPEDGELQLVANTTEVARADNLALAQAARNMVQALATMHEYDWVDDITATRLALKFAGEALGEQEIAAILRSAQGQALRSSGGGVSPDAQSGAMSPERTRR